MNRSIILFFPLLMVTSVTAAPAGDNPDSVSVPAALDAEPTGMVLGRGELREPLGLDVDARGFVFVADAMAGKVYRYSPDGSSLEFEIPELAAGFYPLDIAAQGTFVYVLDYAGNRVLRYDYKGAWLDVLLEFSVFERMKPASLTVSSGGRLLTTDLEMNELTVWTPLLDVELRIGEYGFSAGRFDRPAKATQFGDQMIAVADFGNSQIQILNGSGRFEGYASPGGGVEFKAPRYVCSGPERYLFVADVEGGSVCAFNPSLEHVLTIDGGGSGIRPSAVAVSWDDRLYIADLRTRSILVYSLNYPDR